MINRSLSTIAQSLQNNVVPNVEIPEGISLPIRNDCEFASTEDILKDVAVKLISALASNGGYNIEITIRRLMKHLLRDEMDRKCNLSGQHGKKVFRQTEMMNVVFENFRGSTKEPKHFNSTTELQPSKIVRWNFASGLKMPEAEELAVRKETP